MTTGSQADFLSRVRALLPPWFGNSSTPVLDGVLNGPAWLFSFVYLLIQYATSQLRISSATDGFLDLASADFFGAELPRNSGESDTAFRARIKANFFPARNTRPALVAALTSLTGSAPQVIYPWNPGDVGALNNGATLAWNTAGMWGSRTMPFQCFVIVHVGSSGVTLAQACAAVEAVRPAAVKVWVAVTT